MKSLDVNYFFQFTHSPEGVLRYISDGDVRSPFLGLKFVI